MDDFLIAFGALWVVICAYAIVAYHIRGYESETASPSEPLQWINRETPVPSYPLPNSWPSCPHGTRGRARQRVSRCSTRSPEGRRAAFR